MFSESNSERSLRSEIHKLEQEMMNIPMVDEFAKYTKIQRRHTKLRDDLKNEVSARMTSRSKAQLFFTYAAKIFNVSLLIY